MSVVNKAREIRGIDLETLFREAYEKTPKANPNDWTWAIQLYRRSGIVTNTVASYCKKVLEDKSSMQHLQK